MTARTFLLSRTGQITGRYESGIKQLGDDKITVRIGGVYALEQLFKEGKNLRQSISDVLSSFVRERTKAQAATTLPGDIQAALTVLGRRDPLTSLRPADLQSLVLTGADLRRTRLERAQLSDTRLDRARFVDASLEQAVLRRTSLRDADLSNASLRDADLTEADLRKATLYHTNFAGATLAGCRLGGCDLSTARNLTQQQRDDAIL